MDVKPLLEFTENDIEALKKSAFALHGSGPYHHPAWILGCEEGYGHMGYLVFERDEKEGSFLGLLPLVHIKPPFTQGELVSLPFCDYGGPVARNHEVLEGLLSTAKTFSKDLGARLEVRTKVELKVCPKGLHPNRSKVRLVLELKEKEPEALLMSFKSKLRSQIRRPKKAGCEAILGGLELLDDFYRTFSIKMHELGSPVHSKAFFHALFRRGDPEWYRIVLVKKENETISASVILFWGDTATVPWAASLREYNRISPNMLLYWTMLSLSVEKGCKWFDFGRSTPGSGTYRFKEQWGARPVPLYWYSPKVESKKAGGGLRPIVENVWRRLPLDLANFIGPKIRRFISL